MTSYTWNGIATVVIWLPIAEMPVPNHSAGEKPASRGAASGRRLWRSRAFRRASALGRSRGSTRRRRARRPRSVRSTRPSSRRRQAARRARARRRGVASRPRRPVPSRAGSSGRCATRRRPGSLDPDAGSAPRRPARRRGAARARRSVRARAYLPEAEEDHPMDLPPRRGLNRAIPPTRRCRGRIVTERLHSAARAPSWPEGRAARAP